MNRWSVIRAESDGMNSGLLTFRELAQRLADGRILDEDMVLPEGEMRPIPVDSVVGLCRAVALLQRESAQLESDDLAALRETDEQNAVYGLSFDDVASTNLVSTTRTARSSPHIGSSRFQILVTAMICGGMIAFGFYSYLNEEKRFPTPVYTVGQSGVVVNPVAKGVAQWEHALLMLDSFLLLLLITTCCVSRQRNL